jgi:succinylglutamic semialdehyde dehydrogenase
MTTLTSTDPATGEIVWRGAAAGEEACSAAVAAARRILPAWAGRPAAERAAVLRRYADLLRERTEDISVLISRETGKPLWESRTEVGSMIGKVALSITAREERTGDRSDATAFGSAELAHRPHGVMAVLGPFNFPGHLPNGHLVPALLAGNCVVFKPSEQTPAVGERLVALLREAGVPYDVVGLVQGGRDTGKALLDRDIDGVLFTGSAAAGAAIRRRFLDRPHAILALELGGNNPLIAWDGEPERVAAIAVQSAFITSGQRCSCARRLIVPFGVAGSRIVDAVAALADRLRIGAWNDDDEPFMGPLVSAAAAEAARRAEAELVASGAGGIRRMAAVSGRSAAFVTPGVIEAGDAGLPDHEVFAPLLAIQRARDPDDAIALANTTRFGLAAGLISDDDALWERFRFGIRAGVVNRNRPTTGASGAMPFGGVGESGNHRPSAWYAADYCAYPVASLIAPRVQRPADLPGMG